MGTPTVINLSDTNPPPPSGKINVAWLASTPYSENVTINGNVVSVLARDVSASVPPPGSGGSVAVVTPVALAPGAAGNFTERHGAGSIPVFVLIEMTSSGSIWLQSPTGYDINNL